MNFKKEVENHPYFEYFNSMIINGLIKIDVENEVDEKYKSVYKSSVYHQCFDIIIYLSIKTLVFDINMFSEKYIDKELAYSDYIMYLKSPYGIKSFFDKYTILYEQIQKEVISFIKYANLFVQRLNADIDMLKNKFNILGELTSIEFSKGDSHCGKQTVIKLDFENVSVYYKPKKNIPIKLLTEINEMVSEAGISTFDLPETIDMKGNYSWQLGIEYESSSEEEVIDVYRKYGALACFAYIFNITDLHMNNLIINKGKLFLIDVETFFQRNILKQAKEKNITTEVYSKLKNTTLNTGLFPVQFKKYKNADLSGICGKGNQIIDKGRYKLLNKNRGDMKLVKEKNRVKAGQNIPIVNKVIINPRNYRAYIIIGFETCYRFFMEKQNEIIRILNKYDNIFTRLIYRNTSDYGKFLLTSTNPKYMTSVEQRTRLFSMLYKGLDFIEKFIVENEIIDLLNGDIPYFSSDLCGNIFNSQREKIGELDSHVNEDIDYRLRNLSLNDLEFQKDMIDLVLTEPKKKWETSLKHVNTKFLCASYTNKFNEIIFNSFSDLLQNVVENGIENSNEITWISIDINENEQWVVSPADISMYNGLIGNALCFFYAYDITKKQEYKVSFEKILNEIENIKKIWDINDYSVFLGKGGLIYLYYTLWKKLNSDKYRDMFLRIIRDFEKTDLNMQKLDFISGVSGLLVLLCNIYKVERLQHIYTLIEKVANYIISKSKVIDEKHIWYSNIDGDEILNGLSHGLSGIAYSLIKAWEVTKNKEYFVIGISAIEFENKRKMDGNWIDFRNYQNRKKRNFYEPVYWCHGAAGIGMVRSKILDIVQNYELEKDLVMSVNTVMCKGAIDSDCLCHGKLGNLELLMLEDYRTQDRKLKRKLVEILAYIISENNGEWKSGIPQDRKIYTLMLGESGIAYQLMRFYSEYKIPSVLMLDVPEV